MTLNLSPRTLSLRPTRAALLCLPLLLAACGGTTSTPTAPDDDLPTISRPVRPATTPCTSIAAAPGAGTATSPGWLARLGGPAVLRGVNRLPGALAGQAEVSPSLYDLLLATRLDINNYYYGTSTVDLNALHDAYEATFRKTYGNLKEHAPDSSSDVLMNSYLDAIGDGHTYFLTADQYASFTDDTTATPRFGFVARAVPNEDGAVLVSVQPDAPADQAGLMRGDTLLSVNGTALTRSGDDDVSTARYNAVLAAARSAGGAVTFGVRRGAQTLTVKVTPSAISTSVRPTGKLLSAGTYLLTIPAFDAAVTSTSYASVTAQATHDLLRAAQASGATHLILDLRNDGGGYLVEALGVAGAFNPDVAAMTLETIDGDVNYGYRGGSIYFGQNCTLDTSDPLLTIKNPVRWTGSVEILVNGDSASAAEIVPQMLQAGGAKLYGETTYGIANTTTLIGPLPADRGIAVTASLSRNSKGQYLTAKTTPDVAVTDDLQQLAHGTDTVLQAALNTAP